tara:strand:- start:319 stop:762 length:444 start_codon:yes stop_codon:yes gene_type:complete
MFKNQKLFFSLPLTISGLLMLVLGSRWMIVDEPWLLDKVANEERLRMTFEELFDADINKTLPEYLKQIYRFFGLWVSSLGLFILLFSRPKLIVDKRVRITLLICSGVMIYSGLILGYALIPKSPFIYLGWCLIILHLISIYNHKVFK